MLGQDVRLELAMIAVCYDMYEMSNWYQDSTQTPMYAPLDATPLCIRCRSGWRQRPYLLHSLLPGDLFLCKPVAMEAVRDASW